MRLGKELYIAHMGGEPCLEVQRIVEQAFEGNRVLFFGYGDGVAYIIDDAILAEGGYEAESAIEYCLKGKFKPGLDLKYMNAYRVHFQKIKPNWAR